MRTAFIERAADGWCFAAAGIKVNLTLLRTGGRCRDCGRCGGARCPVPPRLRLAAGGATLLVVDAGANTLYLLLGEPAPEGAAPGRTPETRAKETIDNDVEALGLDLLIDG